jgi:hypothetical protein
MTTTVDFCPENGYNTSMKKQDLLTVAEAAALLDLDPSMIRRYIRRGLIPIIDYGPHARLIEPAALKKLKRNPVGQPRKQN